MKIRNDFLYFDYHELAFSARTSGVAQYLFDEQGNVVKKFYSDKRPLRVQLPPQAKFFLRRYLTGSGYPKHKLYTLPDLKIVAELTREGLKIYNNAQIPQLIISKLENELYRATTI